ncbi:uncharacterized protein N7529_009667 [Penicillium soppii]|uniref:uncharacterized protein n=1 Tax=Penicillium soppii TaxID=69789 RepID=UPI00254747D6|nr:uncharacterized protein N7529_009667 [Penicillium soppii]KAJ5855723.1 hypothetical protein N7529_009667 [Penicillium soppii]
MASLGLGYFLDSESESDLTDPERIPETQLDADSPTQPLPSSPLPQPIGSPELMVESTDAQPTITMPLPPLTDTYNSPEEGIAAINAFGRNHGYAVSTLRSKTTKKGVKKTIYICCDRGRTYRDRGGEHKRQSITLAINCPFAISLRLDQPTGIWSLSVENSSHNHHPSPPSTHAIHRTQERAIKADDIQKGFQVGLPTRQILTTLREENPDSCIIARDIHNYRRKLHMEFLAGRTPLQALLVELPKDGEWIFKYEIDDENHVTALFCMHKSSIAMLKLNPWVISMDCTYKTNMYGLPLLDIVGFAATGSSFHLGLAFMKDEKDDTYEVVLNCLAEAYEFYGLSPPRTILTDKEKALMNAIKDVFPSTKNIICVWHIMMNIMKKARPIISNQLRQALQSAQTQSTTQFTSRDSTHRRRLNNQEAKELREKVDEGWKRMMKRFNRVIYATTFEAYNQKWEYFKNQYRDPIFEPLIDYIQSEWLNDCPEKFLHYHTSHYLHLNEFATSRTEGAHWLLKQDLHVSTNNLLVALQTFQRAVKLQFKKIADEIEHNKVRTPVGTGILASSGLFRLAIGRVSFKPMRHTTDVYTRYLPEGLDKPPIPPSCNCSSKETAGFPCIHLIKQYLHEGKGLEPELFHPHWHLRGINTEPIDPRLLVQDPLPVRRRGRPRGAHNFNQLASTPPASTPVVTTQQSTQQRTQVILSSPDPLTQHDRSVHRDPSSFEYTLAQEGGRGRGRGRGAGKGTKRATQEGDEQASKRGSKRGRGRGRGAGGEGANVS